MPRLAMLVSAFAVVLATNSLGCSNGSSEAPDDASTVDDNEIRAAEAANDAPLGREAHAKLRDLAPKVTLGMFGEDSGSSCRASFRRGPAARFSAEEVLRLFQFNVESQMASDDFSFEMKDKDDAELWATFEETQFDDEGIAAARAIKEIFTSPNVKELAVMIPADREPFSASVFLVGAMKDGSLLVLRGEVGGMGF